MLQDLHENGFAETPNGLLLSQKLVDEITSATVTGIADALHNVQAKADPTYPSDHKAAMKVPKGGSSCSNCEYLADNKTDCKNTYFQKWNGSPRIPAPIDEYCSDWFEPRAEIAAAEEKKWHGVDLDGTIAEYHGWKGISHIGKPIEGEALNKVKAWLKKGERVKIFTARDLHSDPKAIKYIEDWCEKYLGQKIEVTDSKDEYMIDHMDDRVHRVEKNTGEIIAGQEQSIQNSSLWNGIKLVGFTGPEEEALRATLSRIPPELLDYVTCVQSAKELQAKHGRYIPEEEKILFNPGNLLLRQRFGKGEFQVSHADLTLVHEVGHSLYDNLSPEDQVKWQALSGWMEGTKAGQAPAYVESRPGWEPFASKWTHQAGAKFPRWYAEKNPNEDFADCFAFFLLNKAHQIGPEKRAFLEDYIKDHVHHYPQASIQSPVQATGTSEGVRKAWDTRGRGRKSYQKVAERIHRMVTEQPRHHTARHLTSTLRRYGPKEVRQALSFLQRNRYIQFERTTGSSGRGQYVISPRRPMPATQSDTVRQAEEALSQMRREGAAILQQRQTTPATPVTPVPTTPAPTAVTSNFGFSEGSSYSTVMNVLRDGQWHSRESFNAALKGWGITSGTEQQRRVDIIGRRAGENGFRLEQNSGGSLRLVPSSTPRSETTVVPTATPVPESVRVGSAAANSGLAVLRDGQWHDRSEFDNAIAAHNQRQGTNFDPGIRLDIIRNYLSDRGDFHLEENENRLRVAPGSSGMGQHIPTDTPARIDQATVPPPAPVNVPSRIDNPAPGQRQPVGFLTKDPSTFPASEGDKIRISPSDLPKFRDAFKMDPTQYKDTLLKGVSANLTNSATMRVASNSGGQGWQIVVNGPGYEISRSIELNAKSVYHGYFTMSESMQGQGLAKTIFSNSLDLYDHLGLDKIGVSASLAGGGYAWARFGFVPDPGSWSSLASNVNFNARADRSLTPDIKAQVNLISKISDPRAIWLLAGLKDAKGESVGAKLLRGTDWHGTLKLSDPEQYAVVRDYSGRQRNAK